MKRHRLPVVCLLLLCFILGLFAAAYAAEPASPWGRTADVTVSKPTVQPTDLAAAAAARSRLTFKERRELGLTLGNIIKITKDLQAKGELDGLSQSEIAAAVTAEIEQRYTAKNPSANVAAFDWSAILEFIERLVALAIKLAPLIATL